LNSENNGEGKVERYMHTRGDPENVLIFILF